MHHCYILLIICNYLMYSYYVALHFLSGLGILQYNVLFHG